MKKKIGKTILTLFLVIFGLGITNVNAAVNSDYAGLRALSVVKDSKTICAAGKIEVGQVGSEGILKEDKVNAGLTYTFDYYGTKTTCTEKSKIDATKVTQADVSQRWITVGSNKYAVYGCYCDKTTYDNYYESCLNYFKSTDDSACAKNRKEQLDTYYDPNCEDKKWDEPCGTRTPNKELGLKANPSTHSKDLNELFQQKPKGAINACAHSNSFVFTATKIGTKNKKEIEQCLITSVSADKSSYEYKKCSELNKIFDKKVTDLADNLSKGLAGTATTTSVTRSKVVRADGYTEIHIKLGSDILNILKTIPYDNSKNAISDLKVSVYKDDENNQCSEYIRGGDPKAKCDLYTTGYFNSAGDLVLGRNSYRDTRVFVIIEYKGQSPCGKVYTKDFDIKTEFIIHNDVPNTNFNAGVCKIVKDQMKAYPSDDFIQSLIDLVPECTRQTLSFEENEMFNNQQTELIAMMNSLLTAYRTLSSSRVSKVDKSECTFNPRKNQKLDEPIATYTGVKLLDGKTISNSYWAAICTEDLYIDYDTPPEPVAPGTGFLYETRLKVKRNCTMLQLKAAREKSICKVTSECQGDDHKGAKSAGPNEDFEECINTCDNGTYTQKCIDKCYKKVYGDDSKTKNKTSYNIFDVATKRNLALAEELEDTKTVQTAEAGCHESLGCTSTNTTDSDIKKLKKDANGYYLSPDGNYITSCKVYHLNNDIPTIGGSTEETKATSAQIAKAESDRKNCTNLTGKKVYKKGYKYWNQYLMYPVKQFIDYGFDQFYKKVEGQQNEDIRTGVLVPEGEEGCWDNGGGDTTKWVKGGVCLNGGWNNVTYGLKKNAYTIVTENGVRFTFFEGCMGYTLKSYNWNELDAAGNHGKLTETQKGMVKCYEVLDKSDTNCSFNPKEDYYKELDTARQQYYDLIAYLEKTEVPEDKLANYIVTIDETYGTPEKTKTSIFVNKQSSNATARRYDPAYAVNYKLNSQPAETKKTELPGKKKLGIPRSTGVYNYDKTQNKEVPIYRYDLTRYITINIGTAYSKYGTGAYDTSKIANYKLSSTSNNVIYNQDYTGTGIDSKRTKDDEEISNGPVYGYITSYTTKLNVNQPYTWPDARVALDNGKYNYTYTNYRNIARTGYNIFTTATILNEEGEVIPTYTPNISVDIENFGSFKQWTTGKGPTGRLNNGNPYLVKCMYGTKKDAIGNEIIFRPIDLTNVFPGDETQEYSGDGKGRAPRYNWTGTVLTSSIDGMTTGAALNMQNSYYDTETVDPEKLTQYIQNLGEKIYKYTNVDGAPYYEYRFELNPATIRDIRKYNRKVGDLNHDKVYNTYIDYKLGNCVRKNGVEGSKTINRSICSSEFLDTYVSFEGGNDKRNKIRTCNNGSPTSSACETIDIVK